MSYYTKRDLIAELVALDPEDREDVYRRVTAQLLEEDDGSEGETDEE